MQAENELTVLDIRDNYLEWNNRQIDRLNNIFSAEQSPLIKLIPLLLQVNNRTLPGYSGPDVPMGIHRYIPEASVVNLAKSLNYKFEYSLQEIIKFPVIESIIFQSTMLDLKHRCWIFVRDSLDTQQLSDIRKKIDNISKWYKAKGLDIEFILITEDKFNKFKIKSISQLNKSIFLKQFYAESILLAGKLPFWWLVPAESESDYRNYVDYISQARLIEPQNCIDLGGVADIDLYDYLQQAIKYVQQVKNEPEISLINLAILDMQITQWPKSDCLSTRVKQYFNQTGQEIDNYTVLAEILFESFEPLAHKKRIMPIDRMLSSLKNMSSKLNHLVIDAYVGERYFQPVSLKGIDNIISFMNVNKALIFSIREIFSRIISAFSQKADVTDRQRVTVGHANDVLASLSENANRIPLYNRQVLPDILLDKILIRHVVINAEESYWSLIIKQSESVEKKIEGFTSLLGLLTWCWLNRVVSHVTQVSIECPLFQYRQTEARYVLEMIMQYIDPATVSRVTQSDLEKPVVPVMSLVLVNAVPSSREKTGRDTPHNILRDFDQYSLHPHVNCDQVIVDSWGDVYTKSSRGGVEIINCLCEWTHHASLDRRITPRKLYFSGYGTGDSTFAANRLQEIYDAIVEYFYVKRHKDGRFILKFEDLYCSVKAEDKQLLAKELGSERDMLRYLEACSSEFVPTQFERLAYTEYPLKEIFQNNRANVCQVFFQLINGICYTWVLDENGSLFRDKQVFVDRNAYIAHWFKFFSNINSSLDKLGFSESQKPAVEVYHIVLNRLGAYDFISASTSSEVAEKNFYEIGLSIDHEDSTEQLTFVCEEAEFSYHEYQLAAINACIDNLKKRFKSQGRRDVYVTDINASLQTFNAESKVQFVQILQLKRAFEKRIYRMLNE